MVKRVSLVLALLIAGAAAGAYAQEALKQEDPASSDIVQLNVLYEGSFCSGENGRAQEFYFRPLRELKDDWVEAEYSQYLTTSYRQLTFKPSRLQKLNLRQMCAISAAALK